MSLPPLFTVYTVGSKDIERRKIGFVGVSRTLSEKLPELISSYVGPAVHVGVEHVFFRLLLNVAASDSAAARAACAEGVQLLIIKEKH
jgi:hypothetical protein